MVVQAPPVGRVEVLRVVDDDSHSPLWKESVLVSTKAKSSNPREQENRSIRDVNPGLIYNACSRQGLDSIGVSTYQTVLTVVVVVVVLLAFGSH